MKHRVISVLEATFPDSEVRVVSDENCSHIEVYVSSARFAGKGILECHKMVKAALKDMLSCGDLHAVSVRTAVKQSAV